MFLEFFDLINSIISNYSIIEIMSLLVMGMMITILAWFSVVSEENWNWKRNIVNAVLFTPYMTLSLLWILFSLNKPWFISMIPALPIFLIIFVKYTLKKIRGKK